MSGLTLPAACFCLMTGGALGVLFLLFKLVRGLLYGGKLCAAVLDVLFCLIWALTAFLCALVVDKGRLRLFQAALQVLGAWGAIVALDPFVKGATALVRRIGRRVRGWLGRPVRFLRKHLTARLAAAKKKRVERRRALKTRRKKAKGGPSAGGRGPTYRKKPEKSKIYARNKKKPKKPLEKLT